MNSTTIHNKSIEYLHKKVRIKAKNGNVYVGKIVKVGGNKLYLRVTSISKSGKAHSTLFFPFLLPLFFFDLFFIGLLI